MSLPARTPGESAPLWMSLACVFAGLSVAAGAFGAHGLREVVPERDLAIFETAAQYQMYHALALLGVAWGRTRWPGKTVDLAGNLFVAGILLFSGSLYVLVLTNTRWMGAITPFGGLAFMAGWLLLGIAGWRGEQAYRLPQ
jgi:uncharacterized membrane protein YgdD (TMEM256/DUF423 family)